MTETAPCFLKQRHTHLGHDTTLTDDWLQVWLGAIMQAGERLATMASVADVEMLYSKLVR